MSNNVVVDKILTNSSINDIVSSYNNLLDEYQHKTQNQLRIPYISNTDIQPDNIYFMSSAKNNIIHSHETLCISYSNEFINNNVNSFYKLNNNCIIYGVVINFKNNDNSYYTRIFIFSADKVFFNFDEAVKLVPYLSNLYSLKILKIRNYRDKIYYLINNNKYLEVLNNKLLSVLKLVKVNSKDAICQSISGEFIKINIDAWLKLYIHFVDIMNYDDIIIKLIIKKDDKEVYLLVHHTCIANIKNTVREIIKKALNNLKLISMKERDVFILKLLAYNKIISEKI